MTGTATCMPSCSFNLMIAVARNGESRRTGNEGFLYGIH